MSDGKAVFRYPTPFSSLLTSTRFFLLGLFHSLLAAFLGRHPVALASLTSWVPQVNFSFTASCSNVWDPHMIFCVSPKSWCHFSSSALCSTLSSDWSTPLPLLFLVVIPWYWHLQYARVFHCNYTSPKPLIGSLHGTKPQLLCMTPSVLGCQLQLRVHFHQWPSMASHSTKPQLFFMMPSCLQNQYHLDDSYTLPSTAAAWGTLGYLWNTASLCSQKTLPIFHLSDAGLFLITTNFLAPANQHQLFQ